MLIPVAQTVILPTPSSSACIQQAAYAYQVPAQLLQAIIKVEGGKKGGAVRNTNGTLDVGLMQINSIWQRQLKPYGITPQRLQDDVCTNIWVGAWIVRQKLYTSTNPWRAVANYHSASLQENLRYQQKLRMAYQKVSAANAMSS